jgi:hypothetical protein
MMMIYQILIKKAWSLPFKEPYHASMRISTSELILKQHKTKDPKVISDEVPKSEI